MCNLIESAHTLKRIARLGILQVLHLSNYVNRTFSKWIPKPARLSILLFSASRSFSVFFSWAALNTSGGLVFWISTTALLVHMRRNLINNILKICNLFRIFTKSISHHFPLSSFTPMFSIFRAGTFPIVCLSFVTCVRRRLSRNTRLGVILLFKMSCVRRQSHWDVWPRLKFVCANRYLLWKKKLKLKLSSNGSQSTSGLHFVPNLSQW